MYFLHISTNVKYKNMSVHTRVKLNSYSLQFTIHNGLVKLKKGMEFIYSFFSVPIFSANVHFN